MHTGVYMRQLALAELQIVRTDSFIYQRRDGKAPTSPHRLAWFGGLMEDGERPTDAIRRELVEETSLKIARLTFTGPRVFEIPAEHSSSKDLTIVNLFRARVQESDVAFEVYEGSRAEIYTYAGLLATNEVAATVRYIIEQMAE